MGREPAHRMRRSLATPLLVASAALTCGGRASRGGAPATALDDGSAATPAGADAGAVADAASPPPVGVGGGVMDAGPQLPLPPEGTGCAATAQTIVSASQLPSHPSDTYVVIGWLTATPAGLYYNTSTIRHDLPGTVVGGSLWRIVPGVGPAVQVADGGSMPPVLMGTSLLLGEPGLNGADAIATLPLAGGPPRTIFTLSHQENLLSTPVTDGTSVYFTEYLSFVEPNGPAGYIVAVPLDPDAGTSPVKLAISDPGEGIGAFGTRLLFMHPQGEIDTVPLPLRADSVPTRLGTTAPGSVDVLPCSSKACWLAGNTGIDSIDPRGGPLTPVARFTGAVADVWDMAFDGASFYVVGTDNSTQSAETLARVPTDGGAPVVLAQVPSTGGGAIALDSSCIYWSNGAAIFSIARPQ